VVVDYDRKIIGGLPSARDDQIIELGIETVTSP
jgi:hypothetical protein